jgi:hypothetical protein
MRILGIACFVLVIFSLPEASAEPVVGGKAGLNLARFKPEGLPPGFAERTYKLGVAAGGSLQMRQWNHFAPQLEVLFTQRGTGAELDGMSLGKNTLNYLDFALLARFEWTFRSLALYALVGPEANVLLSAKQTFFNGAEADITDLLRRFDISALVGAGVAIGPFSWGTLTFETRYEMGFRHVNKVVENGTATNRTISFMLGYEYRRDRDGDGIPDSKDRCPDEPEDRDGFEDSDGCPDPDNDGDGVADREDLCPDQPVGQHSGRLRGCPEEIATRRF